MFGEVFYGGHITDAMDRRCCTTYLQVGLRLGLERCPAVWAQQHACVPQSSQPLQSPTSSAHACPPSPFTQVLIRPEILPQGSLSDPTSWQPPLLELAPGFRAPLPGGSDAMRTYIDGALPAESPVMYGMHPNAELSLLTSLGETLFRTITDVSGGSGAGGYAGVAARGGRQGHAMHGKQSARMCMESATAGA